MLKYSMFDKMTIERTSGECYYSKVHNPASVESEHAAYFFQCEKELPSPMTADGTRNRYYH